MTYQVLARKWRPQDFASLVGQEPVVTALRNALVEDRIAQAYIFSGIRGVGKTTAARVLAKALNCERRSESQTGDPCNDCRSCTEITSGGSLDVIEVDAATYSKVEQVRELTESLRYAPANDRHKVVVLDEVHRLSRQAFDALLKIVEEPPKHLVFIFATTELDAVPATILSRCQQFQFRRVPSGILAGYLRTVCEQETIEVSDAALRMIARAGEGSVRDSIALLDQLATFGSGAIRDDDANQLLGGLDSGVFHRLLSAITHGESATIRDEATEIERNGWDPFHVFGQFLAYVRDGLHLAMGGAPDTVDLPEEEVRRLGSLAQETGYENLLRVLHLLLAAEETVRRSEFGALALEITWLRAAELPKLTEIERLLAGTPSPAAPATPRRQAPPQPARAPRGDRPRPAPAPAPPVAPPARPEVAPEPEPVPAAHTVPDDPMAAFLRTVRTERQPLAAHLAGQDLVFEDGQLRIPVIRGDALVAKALRRPANVAVLDASVGRIWGPTAGWTTVDVDPPPAAKEPVRPAAAVAAPPSARAASAESGDGGAPPAEPSADGEAENAERPTVQAVLDLLGGTVERVEAEAKTDEDDRDQDADPG